MASVDSSLDVLLLIIVVVNGSFFGLGARQLFHHATNL